MAVREIEIWLPVVSGDVVFASADMRIQAAVETLERCVDIHPDSGSESIDDFDIVMI